MDNLLILGVILLVIAMFLSRGGRPSKRYDIQRYEEKRLAITKQETAMQVRARAGAIEEAARERRQVVLRTSRYSRGLDESGKIETVYGEVVDDPRLTSGAPQLQSGGRPLLPSGEDYAIAKKRKARGW